MRKLKLQVQMSVDGFIAGPNHEMNWMTWNWDDKLKDYVNELHNTVDTILLGRGMAEGFVNHWKNVAANPKDQSHEFGKIMIDYPKFIFSKTQTRTDLINSTMVTGNLKDEIARLKNNPGKDMVVYGGAGFDASLIKEGLIDEYHLFINPAAIGTGMSIFGSLTAAQNLKLVKATGFDCGIVVLRYELKR